ncbi:hypothetical protein [Ensifer aridi]|uniref:maleate cis-trans isomerase family protein n=1 Tax=Ensifer aridi TaxID=1708715 RepID=UPI00358F94F7
MRRIFPDCSISLSATRIKSDDHATVENLRLHIDEIAEAAQLFDPPGAVNVFAYACTSGSAIISKEKLEEKLVGRIPGSRLTSPMTAALQAFAILEVNRVSMLSPYTDEVLSFINQSLTDAGISLSSSASFNLESDEETFAISPESIFEAACAIDTEDSEAFFIPCTALRTSIIIDPLEARLCKPVITAHQAMLWNALRLIGHKKPIYGFGKLLTL